MSFHGLIVFFFLELNNIPLIGCNIVYPFTYGRTSWLLLTGNYEQSCHKTLCAGFCVDKSFQVFWVKSKDRES